MLFFLGNALSYYLIFYKCYQYSLFNPPFKGITVKNEGLLTLPILETNRAHICMTRYLLYVLYPLLRYLLVNFC